MVDVLICQLGRHSCLSARQSHMPAVSPTTCKLISCRHVDRSNLDGTLHSLDLNDIASKLSKGTRQ